MTNEPTAMQCASMFHGSRCEYPEGHEEPHDSADALGSWFDEMADEHPGSPTSAPVSVEEQLTCGCNPEWHTTAKSWENYLRGVVRTVSFHEISVSPDDDAAITFTGDPNRYTAHLLPRGELETLRKRGDRWQEVADVDLRLMERQADLIAEIGRILRERNREPQARERLISEAIARYESEK